MSVGGNGDVLGFRRHGEFRLEDEAVGRHHGAILIELEGTGARVHEFAVHIHLEKAVAFNGHIQGVARVLEIALGEKLVHGRGPHAHAHLDADGQGVVSLGDGTGDFHVLVHQVLELGPAFFEARGVHVGQVVGNNVDIQLLGHHAGGARPKGTHHGADSLRLTLAS